MNLLNNRLKKNKAIQLEEAEYCNIGTKKKLKKKRSNVLAFPVCSVELPPLFNIV